MNNINISLVESPVDITKFTEFQSELPTLFLGFAIKNEYDNQRLQINEKYNPSKQLFLFEKKKDDYNLLPLYGIFFKLNESGKKLASILLGEDLENKLSFQSYENILFEYKVSCNDSYSYLNRRIYPIDFKHLNSLSNDELAKDPKILQHLLCIDENKFDFHKFGAFKLLILA